MPKPLQALVVLALLAGSVPGQEKAQAAVPGLTSVPLFTISWNLTANYVQYDARLKNGKVDPKAPVTAYWIMNQTDGHHEGLTLVERLKGYGFTILPSAEPDSFDMVVVSVKKKTLHITQEGNQFEVTLNIGNCSVARLKEAKVQAHWWHFVAVGEYVDLTGTNVKTGEECHERVLRE
jgi:hypothetical protein